MENLPLPADIPQPKPFDRPTAYADRLGQWYAACVSSAHRKRLGQYFTPVQVADFIATMAHPLHSHPRILDPGAGVGILTCALCEHFAATSTGHAQVTVEAYEADPYLAPLLEQVLSHLAQWLEPRSIALAFRIRTDDFITTHAEVFYDSPMLLRMRPDELPFDVAISNPPYFKIPKSDARAKAAAAVVHGQPNIYALFMAASAALLSPGGQLLFITPRSFVSGAYFRLFREYFFLKMRPEWIHVFGSRRDAFQRDEVLQENVIIKALRCDGWYSSTSKFGIVISSSNGASDLTAVDRRSLPLNSVLDMASADKVLRISVSQDEDEVAKLVRSWPGSLRAFGLEISTGPVVAFRAERFLSNTGTIGQTHAPLLWMHNLHPMRVIWPVQGNEKDRYVSLAPRAMRLLLPDRTYVLLRRFSAKEERRRLVAAPLLAGRLESPVIGLENHLNYVHRPGGTLAEDEAFGIAALFNSSLLDVYFRSVNGNTQVNATELRSMPLPTLDLISEIGHAVKAADRTLEEIDALVMGMLFPGNPAARAK